MKYKNFVTKFNGFLPSYAISASENLSQTMKGWPGGSPVCAVFPPTKLIHFFIIIMKKNDFLRKIKPKSNIMFNNLPPPYEINTFL